MDETYAELGEYISRISRLLQQRSRQLPMAPHQSRALGIIAKGDTHLAELAGELHVTPRAVTEVVRALVELHAVEVTPNLKDKREKIISITPSGTESLHATQNAQNAIARDFFEPLTVQQAEQLNELLSLVLESAQQTLPGDD